MSSVTPSCLPPSIPTCIFRPQENLGGLSCEEQPSYPSTWEILSDATEQEAIRTCFVAEPDHMVIATHEEERYKYFRLDETRVLQVHPKGCFTNPDGSKGDAPRGLCKTIRNVTLFEYDSTTDQIFQHRPSWILVKNHNDTRELSHQDKTEMWQREMEFLKARIPTQRVPRVYHQFSYRNSKGQIKHCAIMPYYPYTLESYSIAYTLSKKELYVLRHKVLEAAACVLDRTTLHRDLSLSNIFVTEEANVIIADWGGVTDPDTFQERLLGSIPYMAPEIARLYAQLLDVSTSNHHKIREIFALYTQTLSSAADAFSMGVILYRLRSETDHLPDDLVEVSDDTTDPTKLRLLAEQRGRFHLDSHFPPGLSPYGKVVWRLLQPDPHRRLTLQEAWRTLSTRYPNSACLNQRVLRSLVTQARNPENTHKQKPSRDCCIS